jgi:hypothetical protein
MYVRSKNSQNAFLNIKKLHLFNMGVRKREILSILLLQNFQTLAGTQSVELIMKFRVFVKLERKKSFKLHSRFVRSCWPSWGMA